MANIFRSKEIYKRRPGVPNEENPLVAIRGAYVVGYWRPPSYQNPTVLIKDIKTKPATVVNFTIQPLDYDEHVVNLLNIDVDLSPINVKRYSKTSATLETDHVVNLLSIDASIDQIDLLQYSKTSTTLETDHVVNLLSIDVLGDGPTIKHYKHSNRELNPEPIVRIKSITTTKATISNV